MISHHACVVCGEAQFRSVEGYSHLPRVTSDAKPFTAGGTLRVCLSCGAIQKTADGKFLEEARAIYSVYDLFALSDGAEQVIFTDEGPVSRSIRLVEFLTRNADLPETGRLLDVGCGTGAALANFSKVLPNWILCGNELTDRSLPALQRIPNFRELFVCPLSDIPLKFDVTTMIHFLEHAIDPLCILRDALDRTDHTGIIFVQVPNVETSPFDLLIADHLVHFTPSTLAQLCRRAGLSISQLSDRVLPKELTLLGRCGREGTGPAQPEEAWQLASRTVNWLTSVLATARSLATDRPIGLFGTSIAGMWLYGALRDQVAFFVDEDTTRIGRDVDGKPVLSPDRVPMDYRVFVPLVASVAEKIVHRYRAGPGEFVAPPPTLDVYATP